MRSNENCENVEKEMCDKIHNKKRNKNKNKKNKTISKESYIQCNKNH